MRRQQVNITMAMLSVVFATSLRAGNLTWNVAGGGTWDTTTANWTGDSTIYTEGDTVTFSNAAGGIITLNVNHSPGGVIVSAASGTYTFTNASITGSGKLTKSGAGKLELRAANTFTGGIDVSAGVIDADVGDRLGNGLIHFTGNATIMANRIAQDGWGATANPMLIDAGVTAFFTRTNSGVYPQYSGNISGAGGVTIPPYAPGNQTRFTGSNTFTGTLTVSGHFGFNSDFSLGATGNTVVLNSGYLYPAVWTAASYPVSRGLQISGSSALYPGAGAVWNGPVSGSGFVVGGSLGVPLFLANSNNSFVGMIVVNTGTLEANHPGCLNGNYIALQNSGLSSLRISGTPTADFTNTYDMGGYNPMYMDVTNADANVNWNGPIVGSGAGVFAKIGAGAINLKKSSPGFTAAFDVRVGRLNVSFNTANLTRIAVSNGATFGGYGTNNITGGGAIAGDGLLDPGSRGVAGIMTTARVDPNSTTGTLDFSFDLGQVGSPDYANPAANSNDVLRLTNAVPFSGDTMTSANIIRVYLPGDLLAGTRRYRGGFYVDQGDFLSSFSGASFQCFVQKAGGPVIHDGQPYDWMTNVYRQATLDVGVVNEAGTQFGGVDGYVTVFAVSNPNGTVILIR